MALTTRRKATSVNQTDLSLDLPIGFCTSIFYHRHALSGRKLKLLARAGAEWAEIAGLQEQHVNAFDSEKIE